MKSALRLCAFFMILSWTSCTSETMNPDTSSTPSSRIISAIQGNLTIKGVNGDILLDKKDITNAEAYYDKAHDTYPIVLTTNPEGTAKVAEFTQLLIGQCTHVYLDNELLASPTIQSQIIGSEFIIGVNYTREKADEICSRINLGE